MNMIIRWHAFYSPFLLLCVAANSLRHNDILIIVVVIEIVERFIVVISRSAFGRIIMLFHFVTQTR